MFHLHCHSTFSMLDGYGTAEQYASQLVELGQSGCAITDHGNIFAHRTFDKVFKEHGLKFIPGVEMYLKSPEPDEKKYLHITVLCKNNEGHTNLCKLMTLANSPEHFYKKPMVTLEELGQHSSGLIILSGCFGNGILHKAYIVDKESGLKKLLALKKIFKDLYVEVQHTNGRNEMEFMRLLASLAGCQTVATCDVHYPKQNDYVHEDLMLAIGQKAIMSDTTRMRLPNNLWLLDDRECTEAGFTHDEIAIANKIAESCSVTFEKLEPIRIENDRSKLIDAVKKGAIRLGQKIKNKEYRNRYVYEMGVIDKLGLHSYFVIMADVISFFKSRGIFIGPARGSSAGSLIAYLCGITEVDPIRYTLSFERFIDINRRDYPDIDTDFPHDLREDIIFYLKEKYGNDRIGRITSYTTYVGTNIFWDIARAYCMDSKIVASLGKEMPKFSNDSVDMESIMGIAGVQKIVEKYPVFKKATSLEGQIRNLGKHASGYIVSPVDISTILAHHRLKDGAVISADKNQAEDMGLIKLDILGLQTLDMIQKIIQEVGVKNEFLYRMEPTDTTVFAEFNSKKVAGIFQFEGPAVKAALSVFTVGSLEDLAFINAVIRPGASNALTGNIDIPNVFKKFIFKEAYFVYQEELMAILRFLEFSWDDVTTIRKFVSKKKVNELNLRYKDQFVERCRSLALITNAQAIEFWEVINKCGEYMFNKCISGDTTINRGRQGEWSIAKLYKIKNDTKWAKENGHWHLHKKLVSKKSWGKTLSVDKDGRVRLDTIKDIIFSGIKECWKITDSVGNTVESSKDHRFLTPVGWKTMEELKPGSVIFVLGKRENCENKYNFYKNPITLNSEKGKEGFQKRPDGHSVRFKETRDTMLRTHGNMCLKCGKFHNRIETAHLDGNRGNNSCENLLNMCPSCHKKHDYALGRNKQYSKGIPLEQAVIVTKEYIGEKETYDIEMKSATHNFIANHSFVSHNSHAVSYAMLGYISMWLKTYHLPVFVKHYMDMADDEKRREMLRELIRIGWTFRPCSDITGGRATRGFSVLENERTVIGGIETIKGIGPAKADAILSGKMDKAIRTAIDRANREPNKYSPWCALDDFGNTRHFGNLPQGEFIIRGRVWAAKDGVAIVEDINGSEKCYFNSKYVHLEEGKVYDLSITKFKWAKIDSARIVK